MPSRGTAKAIDNELIQSVLDRKVWTVLEDGRIFNREMGTEIAVYGRGSRAPQVGFRDQNNRVVGVKKHHIIWVAFRGPIPADHIINHIDGDRSNNALANLECISERPDVRPAVALTRQQLLVRVVELEAEVARLNEWLAQYH